MANHTKSALCLVDGINVDWSYEELKKSGIGHIVLETSSFGSDYPQVSFHLNNDEKWTYWIDFEHDLSKIRYIEKADNFGRRYHGYQRHRWTWWIR